MSWKTFQCTSKNADPVCNPHEKLCAGCTTRECDNFQSPMDQCEKIEKTCDKCKYMKEVKK